MVKKCKGNITIMITGNSLLGLLFEKEVAIIMKIDPIKRIIYRKGQMEKIPNVRALPFVIISPLPNACHHLREWSAAEFPSEYMTLFCVFDSSIVSWRQLQIHWLLNRMVCLQHPNKSPQL